MSDTKPFLDHFAATIPVANIQDSIEWYQDSLGFNLEFTWENPVSYAIMKRDNLVIHLAQVEKDYKLQKTHPSLYVFVRNVEALYEEFKKRDVKLGELVKADYGMTDFDLYDLNGFRITFGQGQEAE
ncbi:VOC family protein [Roseivirga sp.]|uniref:VOC family protein n=1 Tax=Roseivirga sp. TaxID=1964215 RepID=UPI003B51E399